MTSLEVGLFAMPAGLALGVPASLGLARYRFRGREGLGLLLLAPLVVPGVVAGTAIYVFQVETEILTRLPLVASLPGSPRASRASMGPLVYDQFAGLNNSPFGAALSFILMTATLTLSALSNLLIQRRYRR